MPTFLLEEDHNLPLCRIQLTLRTGSSKDEPSQGRPVGLCHFATELMRRGAGGRSRAELDAELDRLGASLHALCSHDSVTFDLITLKEKLPEAIPLLADVTLKPHFERQEASLLQREITAGLDELRDNDNALVGRFFSKALYGNHPYGNPIEGTSESVKQLTPEMARAWHQTYVSSENLIFGAAGDLTRAEFQDLFSRHFSSLPRGQRQDTPILVTPPSPKQKKILLVDKPARTQSQILMGQVAPKWSDPAWLPLIIATTAFGGTFTARLMDEVRVKRGLSYGASAYVGKGREAHGFVIHVFPSAEQTMETMELVFRLYKEWISNLSQDEIDFAKSYLSKSYAFSIQTPEARLRRKTQLELCGIPLEYLDEFPTMVKNVPDQQIQDVLRTTLHPESLLTVLVATADVLEPQLRKWTQGLVDAPPEIQVLPYKHEGDGIQ